VIALIFSVSRAAFRLFQEAGAKIFVSPSAHRDKMTGDCLKAPSSAVRDGLGGEAMSSIRKPFAPSRRFGVSNGIGTSIRYLTLQSQAVRGFRVLAVVPVILAGLFLEARRGTLSIPLNYGWFASYNTAVAAAIALAAATVIMLRKRRRGTPAPFIDPIEYRQELADALPHVLWGTGADGRCEFLNERYTETFGIPRLEAIRDESWADPIHPADRPKMYQAWRGALENGNSNYSAHARVRMNDGSYRWMESVGRSVRSPESGEIVRWFGSLVDVQSQVEDRETISRLQFDLQTITDESARSLARADERVEAIFEPRETTWVEYDLTTVQSMSDELRANGVIDVSSYIAANPSLASYLRETLQVRRASERAFEIFGHEGTPDTFLRWMRTDGVRRLDVEIAVLAALVRRVSSTCGITELVNADGEGRSYPFSLWITDDGVARVSFFDAQCFDDRTERGEKAREELAKAYRIACASALSTSLVHEMSQPITALSLDLATASRLVATGSDSLAAVTKLMDRLRWNAQRLTDIGLRTRDSLKPSRLNHQLVDIVELAERSRELVLSPLDRTDAVITIAADADLSTIEADPVALQQVICALLLNALESGGSTVQPPVISVKISRSSSAPELSISVSDRGSGVREEHLALAFDPFFSTRPNRLGFGLTVCQSVVEGFGGTLTLNNRSGGGAVAAFSIPLFDAGARPVSSSIV
jgi:PAS domain S-box-containing protein